METKTLPSAFSVVPLWHSSMNWLYFKLGKQTTITLKLLCSVANIRKWHCLSLHAFLTCLWSCFLYFWEIPSEKLKKRYVSPKVISETQTLLNCHFDLRNSYQSISEKGLDYPAWLQNNMLSKSVINYSGLFH